MRPSERDEVEVDEELRLRLDGVLARTSSIDTRRGMVEDPEVRLDAERVVTGA